MKLYPVINIALGRGELYLADPAIRVDMGLDEVPLGVGEPDIAIATDQAKPTTLIGFLEIFGHQTFLLANMADTKPLTLKEKVKRFRLNAHFKSQKSKSIPQFKFQAMV